MSSITDRIGSRFLTFDLAACGVCLHLTANGEYNDGADAARDCARGQRETLGDDAQYLVCGGGSEDDDGDLGFSWSDCEACGNRDGGDRYRLHLLIPLDKIHTGRDGRTYVSSRDGGYVEVWKGTRHVSTIIRDNQDGRRVYPATDVDES